MKRILVVDDEVEIVDFLENFLKRFKLNVMKATSGAEALRLYDKDAVDFVFLDVQMGAIDGFTVLEEIKKRNPSAKAMMITGRGEKEYLDRAEKLGVVDYITKPLDLGDLREKIERYIL